MLRFRSSLLIQQVVRLRWSLPDNSQSLVLIKQNLKPNEMRTIIYLVFACAILFPEFTNAQSFFAIRRQRSWMLTGGTGTSTYYGALSNPGVVLKPQPNVNIGLQTYLTPRILIRTEL